MSSRGQLIGSAPDSGIYQPRPVPQDSEDLGAYLSDELLSLGGRLNNVLEGGAFPPQAELPRRYREGMMIYFTQSVKDGTGAVVIGSPGVWLYKNNRWWKLIDDPSSIAGTVFVYQIGTESQPPTPPVSVVNPPVDWLSEPPVKSQEDYIWASPLVDSTETSYTWGTPTQWASGAIDGTDGIDGEPGEKGDDGLSYESRYVAGSLDVSPGISDNTARVPFTIDSRQYTLEIPSVEHSNGFDVVYFISAQIDSEGNLSGTWSDPVKFVTPDTTVATRAWAISADWDTPFPPFNPSLPGLPGVDWSYTQPEPTRDYPIWLTERLEWTNGESMTNWTTPVYYYSKDGVDGNDGPPGEPTRRNWVDLQQEISGNVFDTRAAYDLVLANVTDLNPPLPVGGDSVLQFNNNDPDNAWTERRAYRENTGNPGTWDVVDFFVDGNAVITGSLSGNRIRADSQIKIGGNSGQDVIILDADDPNSRIWVGDTDSSLASFRVSPDGTMSCENAEANNIILSGNCTSTGTITGGTLKGAQINDPNSKFYVDFDGNLTCEDATIRGNIYANVADLEGDVLSASSAPHPGKNLKTGAWTDLMTWNIKGVSDFNRQFYLNSVLYQAIAVKTTNNDGEAEATLRLTLNNSEVSRSPTITESIEYTNPNENFKRNQSSWSDVLDLPVTNNTTVIKLQLLGVNVKGNSSGFFNEQDVVSMVFKLGGDFESITVN